MYIPTKKDSTGLKASGKLKSRFTASVTNFSSLLKRS